MNKAEKSALKKIFAEDKSYAIFVNKMQTFLLEGRIYQLTPLCKQRIEQED